MISILITELRLTDLKQKFQKAADWESVYPYLLNDDDGQKTQQIRRGNGVDVDDKRTKMLWEFYSNPIQLPTWRDIVLALRAGRYNNLADELEHELQS